MSVRVSLRNVSVARCGELPTPGVAYVNAPGLARRRSSSSFSDFTGSDGPTTSTVALAASVHTGLKDDTASNLTRSAYSAGIIAWLVAAASSVRPSGLARATASAASTELAPGLLSTMTGWPIPFAACSANARATMSVGPPAAKPTTSFTGSLAYDWAMAGVAAQSATARMIERFIAVTSLMMAGDAAAGRACRAVRAAPSR